MLRGMCRSIKTLRPPYLDDVEPADIQAAAQQYVRKVAGMRTPSARNAAAFAEAVRAIAVATELLLGDLDVRPASRPAAKPHPDQAHPDQAAFAPQEGIVPS